jgi:hypothetical protein
MAFKASRYQLSKAKGQLHQVFSSICDRPVGRMFEAYLLTEPRPKVFQMTFVICTFHLNFVLNYYNVTNNYYNYFKYSYINNYYKYSYINNYYYITNNYYKYSYLNRYR